MEAAQVLALVEQIIEEHKNIIQGLKTLDQVANDAGAIQALDKAQEDFVPERLIDRQQGVRRWQESLEAIERGIEAHFDREETSLLPAVEEYGDEAQLSSLRGWLAEHAELRERLSKLKIDVAELTAAETHHVVWHGKAWGIRVYMNHTLKLFDRHAQEEHKLLLAMKQGLQERVKR